MWWIATPPSKHRAAPSLEEPGRQSDLANHNLWRDVVCALEDRYRCITIDLPLGAHTWPLSPGADRSAPSLARLLLDCLIWRSGGGRLILTNCESHDKFAPDGLKGNDGTKATHGVLGVGVRVGLVA